MMTKEQGRELLIDSLYAMAYSLREEQPHQAMPLFHLIAKLAPADERGWLGTGACHEERGRLEDALSIYTFGQAAARSARCIAARARTLRKLGREGDASDVLEHALGMEWEKDEESLLENELRSAA